MLAGRQQKIEIGQQPRDCPTDRSGPDDERPGPGDALGLPVLPPVLPSGVNKATGLAAALLDLGLSAHNAVGVGDAENDHAFLTMCECSVATANAVAAVVPSCTT